MPRLHTTFALVLATIALPSLAATFVVPADRDLIHRADAVVTGTTLPSYSQMNAIGGLETVTPVQIESVIAGNVADDVINVVEPGGELAGRATIIAGVPRFAAGGHVLLMLAHTGEQRWAVTELVLGKFSFRTEGAQTLLVRDTAEINGWDPDLSAHRERRRSAAEFIQFIRDEVHGRFPAALYFVDDASGSPASTNAFVSPRAPLTSRGPEFASPTFEPAAAAVFSANSYTMILSGNQGGRWNVFPSAVTFLMGTTQEPGAPGGGATAIQTAFASWNNDAGSNVNYVYGGVDNGSHTQGLHAPDGANTILFERDLSAWGVAAFTCTSNSYGGTLGLGGVTNASGSNTVNGETFLTTQEGDVEMNRGIANCTLLFNNGDWNSAVTHEVGHTLGFRHADQNRQSNGSCSSDPSLECSSSAIMTATVTPRLNAALQPWDINAVRAVYPGGGGGGGGAPPTISSITPTSGTGFVTVTINGTNFVAGAQVFIGGGSATNVRVVSSTQITATNPPLGPGTLNDVTVVTSGGTATLPKAFFANFYDVPTGSAFQPAVEKVVRAGITAGCGGGNYCPNDAVTRAQMSVFLLKARHGAAYTPPAATGTMFTDVPSNSFAAAWIEQLAREGITAGCGPGIFCPGSFVTRAQMAVFILTAEHGPGYTPPAATGTMFADVPVNAFAAAFIEQAAREGITGGCDATHFCPTSLMTRGPMAVWLSTAFRL